MPGIAEDSRRLEQIPGIRPILATALVAEIGDWKAFRSGRNLAAWIGLVPKQHSAARSGSAASQRSQVLAIEAAVVCARVDTIWNVPA